VEAAAANHLGIENAKVLDVAVGAEENIARIAGQTPRAQIVKNMIVEPIRTSSLCAKEAQALTGLESGIHVGNTSPP